MRYLVVFITIFSLLPGAARADRIKDLTALASVRPNQLIGYGLVVGLQGTGEGSDTPFAGQGLRSMLNQLGVSIDGALSDFFGCSCGPSLH
jgi:flagellar P-ring protein precursor FlgI